MADWILFQQGESASFLLFQCEENGTLSASLPTHAISISLLESFPL